MKPDYFRQIAIDNSVPEVNGYQELERRMEIAAVAGKFSVTVSIPDEMKGKIIVGRARAEGFSVTQKQYSENQFIFSY